MRVYVGNLSHRAEDKDVRKLFLPFGEVETARVLKDGILGTPIGGGYVDMPNPDDASRAIRNLNGKEFLGIQLVIRDRREVGNRRAGLDRREGNSGFAKGDRRTGVDRREIDTRRDIDIS